MLIGVFVILQSERRLMVSCNRAKTATVVWCFLVYLRRRTPEYIHTRQETLSLSSLTKELQSEELKGFY